jgi:hypothetical protein
MLIRHTFDLFIDCDLREVEPSCQRRSGPWRDAVHRWRDRLQVDPRAIPEAALP